MKYLFFLFLLICSCKFDSRKKDIPTSNPQIKNESSDTQPDSSSRRSTLRPTMATNSMEVIINYCEEKNIDSIINYCSFPFVLYGSDTAGTPADLKEKLKKYLDVINIEDLSNLTPMIDSANNQAIFTTRDFNSEGELEAESSTIFLFQKIREGEFVLSGLLIAG